MLSGDAPPAKDTIARPRVTVLVGTRNNARTIERCVRSILAQTLTSFELIVLDDGSTDGTAEVVAGIDDGRLHVVRLDARGIPQTLNEGLRLASADIVAIQDADDWSDPKRLERQVEALEADPAVAVVGVRMHELAEDGSPWTQRTAGATGEVNRVLLRFNPVPNTAAAFRRDIALAVGGYDVRYRYACDYDLWLRIAEHHRVLVLDDYLATRELSGRNTSAHHERRQIAESLLIRLRAIRRDPQRRWRTALRPLAWTTLTLITPAWLKRVRRRRLGQAP
jgi:glycosyltransferase involved in cell wall biosynthesis